MSNHNSTRKSRKPLTAADIQHYQSLNPGVSNATTAVAFGVSDRYIRKLLNAAPALSPVVAPVPASLSAAPCVARSAAPSLRVVSRPSAQVSKVTGPLFPDLPDTRGDGRTYWRCPVCAAFVRSPANLSRRAWDTEQNTLHSHILSSAVASSSVVPVPLPSCSVPVSSSAVPSRYAALPAPVPTSFSVRRVKIYAPTLSQIIIGWLLLYWRVPLAIGVALWLILQSSAALSPFCVPLVCVFGG